MLSKKDANNNLFSLSKAKNIKYFILAAFIFNFCFFPIPILANTIIEVNIISENEVNFSDFLGDLPDIDIIIDPATISYQNDSPIKINDDENGIGLREINKMNHLPKNNYKSAKKTNYYLATAYNSEAAQTDSSPCITANGFNLCQHGQEDTVAANFLPFGAKVKIPDFFGDRVFIVRDRMNARYSDRLDIWMVNKSKAITFGVKRVKIEILE
jgi:3D (Asp-Asp-Asp) domain-containing protein